MTIAVPGIATVDETTPTGNINTSTTPSEKLIKSDKILEGLQARITTPDEIRHLKCLIYCRPGIGKTWFGASAPNPCFYDVDGTTISLSSHPVYSKIPIIPYVNEYQGEMVLQKIAEEKLWPDKESFVFDSGTVFQTKSLKAQLRIQLGIRDDKELNSMLSRYLSGDMNWPANTQYMEDIVARLDRIKNKHVIVTAHVKLEKDSSTGVERLLTRPDITAKAYQSFARWANVIGYMDVIGEKRTLRILPSPNIDAKSHIGGPAVINDPTFQSLLDIKEKKQ